MKNKKILAMGVFDLFHIGHLRYLEYAAKQGNYLVVGVLSDQSCMKIKNKYPIIPQEQRMEIIKSLKCVDEVIKLPEANILNQEKETSNWIYSLKVDTVVTSIQWKETKKWKKRENILKQKQINIIYTKYTNIISTSEIIDKIYSK